MEPAQRVGEVLAGKYRLERLLGVGGMGAVYEAVHLGVEKRFAVKIVRADSAGAPDSVTRFTQEARAAARIGHPNLVEVFDMGQTEEGTLYMVMELLVGRSLHEALQGGSLPLDQALEIAGSILSALDAAHRKGFVHRDVKPANIFLADRPSAPSSASFNSRESPRAATGFSVKVLDFGIAKFVTPDTPSLTQPGVSVGTPLYMAPEQVMADREVDGRADVWAVGALLFEMLVGRPVHLAPNATAAAVKVVTETAPRLRSLRSEVDPSVDALVARALAVDRTARFATAGEMLVALDACRTGMGPTQADSGLAPSVATVVRKELLARTRRSRIVMLGVGAASLLLGVVVVVLARQPTGTHPSARRHADGRATAPVAAAATPSAVVNAVATLSASASATPAGSSTAAPTSSAGAIAAAIKKPLPPPPPASCGASEHSSKGHCCGVGLEWQTDHCDRPLATQVPF